MVLFYGPFGRDAFSDSVSHNSAPLAESADSPLNAIAAISNQNPKQRRKKYQLIQWK
jgi:hypothetical protein